MAITYVGGKAAGIAGAASGNTTVDLTAGLTGGSNVGVSAGDMVIVAYNAASTGALGALLIQDPSAVAYTLVSAQIFANDNFDTNLRVAYKFMPTTADANVALGPTGATANGGAYAIHVWRGVSPTQTFDVASATANANNTARADPPSITPITTGAVVVAAAGAANGDMTVAFTFAGVANLIQSTQAATNDPRTALMSVAWTSGAVNIAASSTGSNTGSESWGAITMALRPAGSEKSLLAVNAIRRAPFQHMIVR
jgi:hypothetical protein